MADCTECKYYRVYRGTTDRFGVPQEPDDAECTSDRATEEDLDKYFSDGISWHDDAEGCAGFEFAGYPDEY